MEARLQAELSRLGARNVSVRRVNQGLVPSDLDDVFILEGMVDDIRTLTSVSSLAAKILPGTDLEAKEARVVNRMTTKDRSSGIEGVIEGAIHDLGHRNVRVRRVVQAEFPGDADILVLEGSVPSQTALLHTLTLASKIFMQQELVRDKREKRNLIIETDANGTVRTFEKQLKLPDSNEDLRVVGDESGGLKSDRIDFFGGSSGSALGGILGASGGQNSGGSFLKILSNQLGTNIGRAKAMEIANGRILSLLTVDDLPQVRIDIRLYEVNRTALLSWNSAQSAKVTDFEQPSTLRNPQFVQNPVTGEFIPDPNLPPTDNADVQNVVSFLGGALINNFQISGDHVDINSLFSLLESEGIARRLSNPSLTVLSGELAFFGVGGTVPIESSFVTDFGSGVGSTANSGILNTTTERPFGISLSVRPLVAEDDMITLDVIPSVSNPDPELTRVIRQSTGTDPSTVAFQERALRTSARLRDGQTLLVGGLTERTRKDDSSQTPGLHEIPIIGWLFKGFSYEDTDRELVIVVSPVIIRDAPKSAPIWAFPDLSEITKKREPAPAPESSEDPHSTTGGQ
jgi:Flp pilus assembly secretin CpaC